MKNILEFKGEYRWLSNFWPVVIIVEGIKYPSVEHAFQAAKTRSIAEKFVIAKYTTPGRAKRAGRKFALRADWEEVKVDIMKQLLILKFLHPSLRADLINTRNVRLVEGNNWGRNVLGELLMEIRDELQGK